MVDRPRVWEPEDCVFPQDAMNGTPPFILVRKAPNGDESWDGVSPPNRATYSIALVTWKDEPRLAVRFDGDEEHPNGVPSSNSWPSWFILPRPLQALLLLNGRLVNDEAAHFARRVVELAGPDPAAQIRVAYELALTRPATVEEIQQALDFLKSVPEGERSDDGLVGFCHVLFNLNEFVYVD